MANHEWRGRKDTYRPLRQVGEGLLSSVEVVADSAQREYILKRAADLSTDLSQEAEHLERLHEHPGVVQLVDRIEEDGRTVGLILEYLQGYLNVGHDLLSAQGFTGDLAQLLDLCRQFSDVLAAAHEQGIEYYDFKPEHLLWNGRQLRVVDWNVARPLTDGGVGRDLYKFGELLLHLLTGNPIPNLRPFPPISFVESDPALLALDYPEDAVPPTLVPLLERLLRGDYETAASLAEEIRLHAQIQLQISLPPAGILAPVESLMDRRRYREAALYLEQITQTLGDQDTVQGLLQEAREAQETLVMAYRTRGLAEVQAALWDKAAQSFKLAWREAPEDRGTFLRYVTCHLLAEGELAGEAQTHLMGATEAFADGQFQESLEHFRALAGDDTPALREVLHYVQEDLVPHILTQVDDPSQVGPIVRFFPDSDLIQARYEELIADQLEKELLAALEAHDYEEALEAAARLREAAPEHKQAARVLKDLAALPRSLEEARKALQEGRFAEAAAWLQPVMDNPWVRGDTHVEGIWARARAGQVLEQARAARARGAYAQAVALLERCRQELEPFWSHLQPQQQTRLNAESRASRAWLEYSLGEHDTAVRELEAAVQATPEATAWQEDLQFMRQVKAAADRLADEAYDEAVRLLEEATGARPNEPRAAQLLKWARDQRNRGRVRTVAFQKARSAEEHGQFERALEIYQHMLLEGYAAEDEIRERIAATLALQAGHTQERLWQEAQALREAGRLGAAQEALHRLLEKAPDFPGAADALVAVQEEQALRATQAASWGQRAFQQGDLSVARKHFLQALEHAPDHAEARAYLADLDRLQEHLEEGRRLLSESHPDKAMERFRRAILLCPACPEAQSALHEARRLKERLARDEALAQHSLRRAEEAIHRGELADGQGYLQDLLSLQYVPPALQWRARLLQVETALLAHRPEEARQHLQALSAWAQSHDWHQTGPLTRLSQALEKEEKRHQEAAGQVQKWLAQGRQALAEGRPAEAEEAAARVLALRPRDDVATGLLQTARREQETHARAHHLMSKARALLSQGEVVPAEKAARRALELTPQDPEVQRFLREVRVRQGLAVAERALVSRHFDEARTATEEVLRLDPANGKAQRLLERIGQAREAYLRLRRLVGKGNTALCLRDYRQAVECFAEALELSPDDPEVQTRYEDALRGLQELVATHRQLAQQALEHRDFEAADAYLQVAQELAPADPALTSLRASLERAAARARETHDRASRGNRALLLGDYEEAAELLEWAATDLPADSPERTHLQESAATAREMQTLRLQARNALESRMYDQAISLLERILGQFPRDEESRTLLQECLSQREEATHMIQQLLKQVRQSEQSGQYDRALDLCITAENVYPWQREITASRQRIHKLQTLLELMQKALQLGNHEEAWVLAQEGYELNPYDSRFQQVVRQGEYAAGVAEAREALDRGDAQGAVARLARLMEEGLRLHKADHDFWELATAIATAEEALVEGDYQEAEDILRPVAREHPVARRLWQRIRRAHRLNRQGHQALDQAGDLDEAERCFRLILADGIEDEDAREGLRRVISSRVEKLRADSEAALDRGDSATALHLAQRTLRDTPDDPKAEAWAETCRQLHDLLASASRAYADGDRATALAQWSEAVQIYPSPAVVALIEQVKQEQAGWVNRLVGLLAGQRPGKERSGEGG